MATRLDMTWACVSQRRVPGDRNRGIIVRGAERAIARKSEHSKDSRAIDNEQLQGGSLGAGGNAGNAEKEARGLGC